MSPNGIVRNTTGLPCGSFCFKATKAKREPASLAASADVAQSLAAYAMGHLANRMGARIAWRRGESHGDTPFFGVVDFRFPIGCNFGTNIPI